MFNVLACSGVPAEVCHRLGLRLDLKISLRRLVHPSPNFTGGGVEKSKVWPQFLIAIAIHRSSVVSKYSNVSEI